VPLLAGQWATHSRSAVGVVAANVRSTTGISAKRSSKAGISVFRRTSLASARGPALSGHYAASIALGSELSALRGHNQQSAFRHPRSSNDQRGRCSRRPQGNRGEGVRSRDPLQGKARRRLAPGGTCGSSKLLTSEAASPPSSPIRSGGVPAPVQVATLATICHRRILSVVEHQVST
jgi:hypothetical protein